jgi:hypothetical protein
MANLEDILSGRSGEYQLNNAEIVAGGSWSWNSGTETLAWSSGAYISIPGMVLSSNAITAANLVMASGSVAYVIANIRTNTPTTLSVVVVASANLLPQRNDLYVIARRDGADVILDDEYRLKNGQSFAIGETPDEVANPYWEQLELVSPTSSTVAIQNSDYTFQGETLTFTLMGKVVTFAGATIDFTAGTITGASSSGMLDITTAIPTTLEYAWYIFSLATGTTQADGSTTVAINVSIGASNAVNTSAVYPTMPPSVPIGAVRVRRSGAVAVVDMVRKFGGQSSSIGSVILSLFNNTGSTVVAGTVVGGHPSTAGYLVVPQADDIANCESVLGVVVADIANGATGFVQVAGEATVSTTGLTLGARAYLSSTVAGELTSTPPSTTGEVVFVVGFTTATNKIVLFPHLDTINQNIYYEALLVVSGAPANSNQVTGPILSGVLLTLPNDSRNSGSARTYIVGSGELLVFLNGVQQVLGIDYYEVGAPSSQSNQIQIQQDLLVTDEIVFRIDLSGEAYFSGGGGGGSSDLQTAYLLGNTINISTGVPVTITGASGKLMSIQGDLEVTGVIDPTALQLTPVATNPLPSNKAGIYADSTTKDLIYTKGDGSDPIDIIASLLYSPASAMIKSPFTNQSGSTISAMSCVSIDSSGYIKKTNPTIQTDSEKAIGITLSAINNGASGYVFLGGRLENVTLSASLGDRLWVALDGSLTGTTPEIGSNGFVAGNYVIRLGSVASNNTNPTNKDIILVIQLVGQL